MKEFIKILLLIIVTYNIIYLLLYVFYFDDLCNRFSWVNETNSSESLIKLAKCKDNRVCYTDNIHVNNFNNISDWSCLKKETYVFWYDFYLNLYNNLRNSKIK
jgi:hypothetical protein